MPDQKQNPKIKGPTDPYKNEVAKDGMDFEVSKSPMEEGFVRGKPLPNDKGPIALP